MTLNLKKNSMIKLFCFLLVNQQIWQKRLDLAASLRGVSRILACNKVQCRSALTTLFCVINWHKPQKQKILIKYCMHKFWTGGSAVSALGGELLVTHVLSHLTIAGEGR